ncbi:hypothetical protein GIB67_025184 [Kingdonia uniflora]|uniref:STL11/RBM22-like N-terminal domain-containing protein n=1 Tax=Kingdonia uniflora TaxID=39325 RepID=A0A7J7N8H0_9MAGN|nr:hypothetical protein GIB67_025184 [Kingdonia uniflora]
MGIITGMIPSLIFWELWKSRLAQAEPMVVDQIIQKILSSLAVNRLQEELSKSSSKRDILAIATRDFVVAVIGWKVMDDDSSLIKPLIPAPSLEKDELPPPTPRRPPSQGLSYPDLPSPTQQCSYAQAVLNGMFRCVSFYPSPLVFCFIQEKCKTARLVFTDVTLAELLAEEATSNEPNAPDAKTMTRIAEASFDIDDYWRVVDILHRSKFKNVCQVCLLDLEYGLPVQVRDTALSINSNDSIPKSDVDRAYFIDEHDQREELERSYNLKLQETKNPLS